MITQVKVGQNYINTSVAITNDSGQAIDAAGAEAWFYKISQIDGSLSLDTNIDTDGKVTLNKQDGQTGFYGASIAISSLSEAEYVILYKITVEAIETITVEYLSIDIAKKQIGDIKTETDRILGLSQENFKLFDTVYTDDNMINCKIRTYPTAEDCNNDTNKLAEYQITAAYTDSKCISYKSIKA